MDPMLFLAVQTIPEAIMETVSPEELIERVLIPSIKKTNCGELECQELKDALYHLDQAFLALHARKERMDSKTSVIPIVLENENPREGKREPWPGA